ncbi:MAG TPA: GntR family transcriptional regulator [Thermoanaerobaculia bacterium]|nr:GntR family transcriptional regulator [Thermoanaerobaculia bacterium]
MTALCRIYNVENIMQARSGPERHRQLRQWVADRLRAEILEGRRRPGDWLRQESVAREEGVSQTPVREALKQLVAEGLLEHVPYRGIRVVTLSVEDAEDLYASRAVLEPMAARHAARAISPEEVRELSSLHERMIACEIPARLREYRDLNRRFHEAIIAASRRPFLTRTLGHLWSAFPTMLWSNVPGIATTSSPEREDPDAAEHAEIVAALAARDADRAAAAVKRHVEEAGRTLVAAMRAQP